MLLQIQTTVSDTINQTLNQAVQVAQPVMVEPESYFSLLLKGGWILVPLFLLFAISIYVIIERIIVFRNTGRSNDVWFERVKDLVYEYKFESAEKFCQSDKTVYSKVVGAGLAQVNNDLEAVEQAMESEATQQITMLENRLNWLGITASVAPMLGFLGTIFGVIKIFFNITQTNEFEIATIADGLYQKMISSGVGLFVGIIAYTAFYLLNGRLDRITAAMDKYANDLLIMLRGGKK